MENKKPVCLHYHVFKNGGQTLAWIFEKNFSKNAIRIDTDNPSGVLSNDVVLDYVNNNQETKAISSHQIRFPVPESPRFHFISVMFIRHPIDRAVSVYYFNRSRTDSNRKGAQKAKSSSLNDYFKWSLKVKQHKVMKNFQVLYLSKNDVRSNVDKIDLQLAIDRIKKCDVLGVVDRFDESLTVAEETLKDYFPDIDLSYIKQNVTPDRRNKLTERLDDEKSLVEENIMNATIEENQLDMKLHSVTNLELDNRLKEIKNFDTKLEDFQNRCKKLDDSTPQSNRFLSNERILYSLKTKRLVKEKEKGKFRRFLKTNR